MAESATVTPEAPTSILNTPPPAPPVTPESTLYPATPTGTPAPSAAPVPPAVPQAAPTETPKAPTEPTKPEVPKTPPTVPTDYTLSLPEGSLLSAEDLAALVKETKEAGLSKEQAEKVLSSRDQVATNTATRIRAQAKMDQDKAMNAAKVLWTDQVKNDPVLGGEHLPETALLSSRGYNALTTPEERKMVSETGMDFHPIFVRMMAKVGKLIGEDPRLILGSVGGTPASRDPAEVLYGKTTPNGSGKTG